MQNALKSNEWRWIWVYKGFKIEIQKGGGNNSGFVQNWFQREIRSPLFNLQKFQDSEKSTPELCRMHWSLMNDNEFGSTKLLKLKYRKEEGNNSEFLQNWFRQEIRSPPHLFLEILRVWEQYSWIMQNALKSNEWQRIWVCKTFKIEIQKGGPNNSDFLENWLHPEIRSSLFNL